jgi:2-(1,2-epoxy-1,2-dihydrophenyl)acetyl-CoA isomerase
MTETATVLCERREAVALITLNRPAVLNAFDAALRRDIRAAIDEVNHDASVRAVVLTGAGRGFSAGADLAEGASAATVEQILLEEYKPAIMAIARSPKPWIAAVNGAAAGIGSSFAMACDLVLMAENAYLYQAFMAIALIPDGGATWQLVRQLGPKRAFEMIVDGEKMRAARCVELGLANRVVAPEALLEEALAWAGALSRKAPLALRYSKEALAEAMQRDLAAMIDHEAALQALALRSKDAEEGVRAFLEKRPAVFSGS